MPVRPSDRRVRAGGASDAGDQRLELHVAARGLLGRMAGETIEVDAPRGAIRFQIVAVEDYA
jgi:hypothetical protein